MEERRLKVYDGNKTFFSKLTTGISKLLVPTRVGLNTMLITIKRNNMLKAFENSKQINENNQQNKEAIIKKYEDVYALYLESIDKYIMDSIYKKVKNRTASSFEENALSKYYTVIHLKETQYLEYKHRKQKYLLELDYETINDMNKPKLLNRYKKFYVSKMDSLYKGILKTYSIRLSDNNIVLQEKNEVYDKIFETLEEYITNILPIKIEEDNQNIYKEILTEYDKFNRFLAGKLDKKDNIEKKIILIGISRKLFTHSLPLIVAEQCYIKLLKETRQLIISAQNKKKAEIAYQMLIDLIEDYNIKLLSTKIYWDKPSLREEYKEFWKQFNELDKKNKDYQKQKEILFIKNDVKALNKNEKKYKIIIRFEKNKLVELGAMRQFKDSYKSKGNYIKITSQKAS